MFFQKKQSSILSEYIYRKLCVFPKNIVHLNFNVSWLVQLIMSNEQYLMSTPRGPHGSQSQDGEGQGLAPVVAQHYNEIQEKGLEAREESKIVILRKYNNWAKSMNFSKFVVVI